MAPVTDYTTHSPATTIKGDSGITTENLAIILGFISAIVCPILVFLLKVLIKNVWPKCNPNVDEDPLLPSGRTKGYGGTGHGGAPTKGKQDTDPDQASQKAEEALKYMYKKTGSYVQMRPLVGTDTRHITSIYTKLRLVKQVDMTEKIQTEESTMEYEDMFQCKTSEEKDPIKRIIITGSAGIGKTILIDKIAYDWAMGNSRTLDKYKLVFVLKMRSLKHSSNLTDAIFNHQLLDKCNVDESALRELIDKKQDKVLILLDGFDELKAASTDKSSFDWIRQLLKQTASQQYWVVITSRPPLQELVPTFVQKPYTHVIAEGFSNTDIKAYVNKFFRDDHDKADKLIEQIEYSDTLSDLAKSPMLLLLMCLLGKSLTNAALPYTMTGLYNKALKYIFERKTRDIKDDAISKILISIGKVALGSLLSKDQSFAFREGDFEKSALDAEAAMNAGVLTSETVIDEIGAYQVYFFIHHTFLEYCAAMYWKSLINTEEFDRILDQTEVESTECATFGDPHSSQLSGYEYLFRFCCGDNEACTNRILKKIHQGRDSRLVVICYFESQSKELPPENVISSILTDDIDISEWNNDSTNAFFHFLKQVAAIIRGNNYFPKVKSLVMNKFNFQRFGTDLTRWLNLLTNCQSLALVDSSLTVANTNQILSSLASLSTLTELDLSQNRALGGSVSLLAPQLMELSCLKKLHLTSCSLEAKDVSPIAESTGDTLVNLDVSWNRALGDNASIWGPQLGEMKCLHDVHLEACSLRCTDIEPIAVALSGVSTLVNLSLKGNSDLRGWAYMWALHLKGMRHLKKVNLGFCRLIHEDIKPIAMALSGLSTQVNLNLISNEDLGGWAEEWAQHLKGMTNLEQVHLCYCSLRDTDVEPIAVALSDIQNLVYLKLNGNKALGYFASLWALHLKKMNHLKQLLLADCNLTYDDMEPIAESVSDMPNLILLDLRANEPLIDCASFWAPHLKLMTKHLKKLIMSDLTDEDEEYIDTSISLNSPILELE